MRDFTFLEPASIERACDMLAELGERCRVMAGGTALVLTMRQRMVVPEYVVSLGKLDALREITYDAHNGLCIGAAARHIDVARHEAVQRHYPMLFDVVTRLANPQVRNQGTVGGNLCYADPATDPPGCLIALDARVVAQSVRGSREIALGEFYTDYYTTALAPDEIVTQIRVPPMAANTVAHYTRFLRTAAEHRPLVNVALVARRDGERCAQARLVIGASVVIPTRALRGETLLAGQTVTSALAGEVAAAVAADIEPISDHRGSSDYRRSMVEAMTKRTIQIAFGIAQQER